MNVGDFRKLPLLGILRGVRPEHIVPLVDAVTAAELRTIEVTMNTGGAPELIREILAYAGERLTVGAGTVLDTAQLETARAAGASFIVLPTFVPEVVERCVADHVPVFPGALTPGEVYEAWRAGATMVKLFPAGAFGPAYLKEIKGPFPDIPLLAVGGVTAENMASYFAAGASGVAFGASVFRREWLDRGDYARIRKEVRRLVEACRAAIQT